MDNALRLAMHRAGCVNRHGANTRDLWRMTYRQFRHEARIYAHVQTQLINFRGFAGTR